MNTLNLKIYFVFFSIIINFLENFRADKLKGWRISTQIKVITQKIETKIIQLLIYLGINY